MSPLALSPLGIAGSYSLHQERLEGVHHFERTRYTRHFRVLTGLLVLTAAVSVPAAPCERNEGLEVA